MCQMSFASLEPCDCAPTCEVCDFQTDECVTLVGWASEFPICRPCAENLFACGTCNAPLDLAKAEERFGGMPDEFYCYECEDTESDPQPELYFARL